MGRPVFTGRPWYIALGFGTARRGALCWFGPVTLQSRARVHRVILVPSTPRRWVAGEACPDLVDVDGVLMRWTGPLTVEAGQSIRMGFAWRWEGEGELACALDAEAIDADPPN